MFPFCQPKNHSLPFPAFSAGEQEHGLSPIHDFQVLGFACGKGEKAFKASPLQSRRGGQTVRIQKGLGYRDPGASDGPVPGSAGRRGSLSRNSLESLRVLPV